LNYQASAINGWSSHVPIKLRNFKVLVICSKFRPALARGDAHIFHLCVHFAKREFDVHLPQNEPVILTMGNIAGLNSTEQEEDAVLERRIGKWRED
jgi:hypothetical protein